MLPVPAARPLRKSQPGVQALTKFLRLPEGWLPGPAGPSPLGAGREEPFRGSVCYFPRRGEAERKFWFSRNTDWPLKVIFHFGPSLTASLPDRLKMACI